MIVSHKHKFIFVKTHKTATQTFLKFIKPHLGADDVMAGDPPNDHNADTRLNIETPFPETGKTAKEYQDIYGNHLPWFIIKEIVGDNIWNEYTKITIEREPRDRILSLFYMMNFAITSAPILLSPDATQKKHAEQKEKGDNNMLKNYIQWSKDNTIMTAFRDDVRSYFEEWTLTQLETLPLNLTDKKTYGSDAWDQERLELLKTARKFKYNKLVSLCEPEILWKTNNGREFMKFPYTNTDEFGIATDYYSTLQHLLGQCRFLNYGNYFDGNKIQVDHVVNFNDVGNNIGKCFDKFKINIKCNKNIYDSATQNAHYRKNLKGKPDNNWWYSGTRSAHLNKVIDRRFYSDNMNDKQINFNKIISS